MRGSTMTEPTSLAAFRLRRIVMRSAIAIFQAATQLRDEKIAIQVAADNSIRPCEIVAVFL